MQAILVYLLGRAGRPASSCVTVCQWAPGCTHNSSSPGVLRCTAENSYSLFLLKEWQADWGAGLIYSSPDAGRTCHIGRDVHCLQCTRQSSCTLFPALSYNTGQPAPSHVALNLENVDASFHRVTRLCVLPSLVELMAPVRIAARKAVNPVSLMAGTSSASAVGTGWAPDEGKNC